MHCDLSPQNLLYDFETRSIYFADCAWAQGHASSQPSGRASDSPYLAPVPHRGKTNRPALVRHVAEEVARLRGMQLEDVARATTDNFGRLFKPPNWS